MSRGENGAANDHERRCPPSPRNQGDAKEATVLRLTSTEAEDGGRISGRLRPSGVPCLLLVKAEPGGPGTPKSRLPFQILETSAHFAREQGVCTATACKTRPMEQWKASGGDGPPAAGSRLGVSGRGTAAEPEAPQLPAAPPSWPRDVYTRFDAIRVKSLLKQNAVLSRRHQNMTGGGGGW